MRPGELFAERFEIERLAGSGGMGEVYRARDVRSTRRGRTARERPLGDHALRRSFLERVPENARTLELARHWLGEEAKAAR